jgi:hypothetical protein
MERFMEIIMGKDIAQQELKQIGDGASGSGSAMDGGPYGGIGAGALLSATGAGGADSAGDDKRPKSAPAGQPKKPQMWIKEEVLHCDW